MLRRVNATLALASVVFRAIEAALYAVAVVSLLSVLPPGQHTATARANSATTVQTSTDALLSLRDHATLAGVLSFTVGASLYYLLFYVSRLIPRWLSGWGFAGVLLLITACVSALFSNQPVTGYTLLILPIAVQEIVLAVWLIGRGVQLSPQPSDPLSEGSTPGVLSSWAP